VKVLGGQRNHVFMMRYRQKECVLKQFVVGDATSRLKFEKEVNTLARLKYVLNIQVTRTLHYEVTHW
jgi:hypothetical protein